MRKENGKWTGDFGKRVKKANRRKQKPWTERWTIRKFKWRDNKGRKKKNFIFNAVTESYICYFYILEYREKCISFYFSGVALQVQCGFWKFQFNFCGNLCYTW